MADLTVSTPIDALMQSSTEQDMQEAIGLASALGPGASSRAARQGIISDGSAAMAVVGSPSAIELGTADVSFGMWIKLADWTPSTVSEIFSTDDNATGFQTGIYTDGTIWIVFRTPTNIIYSTEAIAPASNGWAFVSMALDRTGSAIFYLDGQQLGDPVDISGYSAGSFSSTVSGFYIGGHYVSGAGAAATRGESFIYSGILSATQMAQIHANGTVSGTGIAMLANWTPGTHDFIIEDVSGNDQHALMGTTGLSFVHPVEMPGTPASAPQTAIRSDGSAGSQAYATLNDQNPGTGDFTLVADISLPTTPVTTTTVLASLTSSTTDMFTDSSAYIGLGTAGVAVQITGATKTNNLSLISLGLLEMLYGRRFQLSAVREGNTMAVYMGIDGKVLDVTNMFSELTSGSGANWSDTVNGTILTTFHRTTAYSGAFGVPDLRLYNTALTLAEARAEYERGEPGAEWVDGDSATYASDFSAGLDGFIGLRLTQSGNNDGVSDGATSYDDTQKLVLAVSTSTKVAGRDMSLIEGERYRISGLVYIPSANTQVDGVAMRVGASINGANGTGYNIETVGTWTAFSQEFTRGPDGSYINFLLLDGGSVSFTGANATDEVYLVNLVVARLGLTTRLRTDTGGGFQAPNDRSANGSTNFELTGGLTWTPKANIGDRVALTTTYAHDEISATAFTTVHGYWPATKYVVRDIQANRGIAFDSGITVDVGNGSNAAAFASAIALDATGGIRQESLDQTDDTGLVKNMYIQKSGATTQGEVTVTVILERVF